jgi:hypothetical protein
MPANYVLLEKIVVGAAGATSVTFNSIPQTGYTDLVIKVSGRSARAGQQADNLFITFNATTTGYTTRNIMGNGSTASSASYSIRYAANAVDAAGSTASTFSSHEIYIPNYASANNKSYSVDSVSENNATAAQSDLFAGLWSNTAAITSIALQPEVSTWVQYSTFYLYGVAKLGTTPAIAPKATGGDVIQTDGTYWYHAFLSSGTFTPYNAMSCDYLVVAGGGSGGSSISGGGGAGGYRTATGISIATAQTVTIGAGAASPAATTHGINGTDSTFNSTTSAGGGGGGSDGAGGYQGANGGSGGGNGAFGNTTTQSSGNTPSTSPSQGNNGGATPLNLGAVYPSGGGGGAGAVGGGTGTGPTTVSGNGGAGLNTLSTWFSATGTGVSGYVAGGGGGGGYNFGTPGTGGAGGGGNGAVGPDSSTGNGSAGTANTGGGGGGSGNTTSIGGKGGSGLVIVRYTV